MSTCPNRPLASPLSFLTLAALCGLLLPGLASAATVTTFPDESADPALDTPDAAADASLDAETSSHSEPQSRASVRKRRRTVLGDLSSRWFHVGGGAGMVADPLTQQSTLAGRFTLGGGAYTIGLYGGGSMEVTGSPLTTPSLSAVGNVGVAIPVPVVHPMIGVRGLVGVHAKRDSLGAALGLGPLAPHVGAGLQAGFIIREFDGRPGVRVMVDGGVEVRPDEGTVRPDLFVTVAAVF